MRAFPPYPTLLLLAAGLAGPLVRPASAGDTGKVGYTVADFTLRGADGKAHALRDFRDSKAVVVLFLGTQCPINNAYAPRLAELHRNYSGRGVQFLGVNSNRGDTPERVAEHARE